MKIALFSEFDNLITIDCIREVIDYCQNKKYDFALIESMAPYFENENLPLQLFSAEKLLSKEFDILFSNFNPTSIASIFKSVFEFIKTSDFLTLLIILSIKLAPHPNSRFIPSDSES